MAVRGAVSKAACAVRPTRPAHGADADVVEEVARPATRVKDENRSSQMEYAVRSGGVEVIELDD